MTAISLLYPNLNFVMVGIFLFIITSGIVSYFFLYCTKKPMTKKLPKMPMRDFTPEELRKFDGTGPDGRILVAVNGDVFDVTNHERNFYGTGGPYALFAGRDVSRSLTMFNTNMLPCQDEYDDLSDISSDQMNNLKEWNLQFREQYHHVGRLLAPSEPHRIYDPEDEITTLKSPDSTIIDPKHKDE